MKLFTKYSRINVMATVIIFFVASIAFYFTLRIVFISQIDEDLKIEEKEIETYVKEHNQLPESISVNDQLIHYEQAPVLAPKCFAIKQFASPDDQESEDYRQLVFGITAANKIYTVTVSKSMEEAEGLTQSIFIIAFTTILVILLAAFIINRVVLKRIWKPFYNSLEAVRGFKVGTNIPLKLPCSNIDEFEIMNETLLKITSQAELDYLSLKTFSENASHEIQTPLAVIRSKLDLLSQDEKLTEKQSKSLQAAYNSVQKLTKLNQSLLLLAKIENNQFSETRDVDLNKMVTGKILDFQELWLNKKINIDSHLQQVTVNMNEELASVLLNNLFSNATKHNFADGRISIELNEHFLEVSNTSHRIAIDSKSLYHRFCKTSDPGENNGLGLSIVKQICDSSAFDIDYKYKDARHVFRVSFK